MTTRTRTIVALLAVPPVFALTSCQPVSNGSDNRHLEWNQAARTLAEANSYTYRLHVDTGPPIILTGVACVDGPSGSSFVCRAALPKELPRGVRVVGLSTIDRSGRESSRSDREASLDHRQSSQHD
jgi:hypothetical protein